PVAPAGPEPRHRGARAGGVAPGGDDVAVRLRPHLRRLGTQPHRVDVPDERLEQRDPQLFGRVVHVPAAAALVLVAIHLERRAAAIRGLSRLNAMFSDVQPTQPQPYLTLNRAVTTPKRPVAAGSPLARRLRFDRVTHSVQARMNLPFLPQLVAI